MSVRRSAALAVVVLLAAGAAACGGGSSGDGADPATPAPEGRTIKGPGCQYIVAGTERRFTKKLPDVQYLQSAVAEPTQCYDKITFTFDKGAGEDLPPGYNVEYREAPFGYDGIPNSTAGFDDAKAVLVVEFQPASAAGNADGTIDEYKGNLRLGLPKEIRHTTIVEWLSKLEDTTPDNPTDDKVVWLIGLDRKMPFTVDAANQPPHVSVLIMHDS
jgi:hypothetical protein